MKYEFSKHALDQIEQRGISIEMVLEVVHHSDSMIYQDESIKIFSKLVDEGSKVYLYRVFVNYI